MFKRSKDAAPDLLSGGGDDLGSPLAGQPWHKVIIKIVVAIAIPGGVYVLAALVILPLIARLFLKRADKWREEGDAEKALKQAGRAVRFSRGSAGALIERASLHLAGGDLDAARADIERALKKQPDHEAALALRAEIDARRGEGSGS